MPTYTFPPATQPIFLNTVEELSMITYSGSNSDNTIVTNTGVIKSVAIIPTELFDPEEEPSAELLNQLANKQISYTQIPTTDGATKTKITNTGAGPILIAFTYKNKPCSLFLPDITSDTDPIPLSNQLITQINMESGCECIFEKFLHYTF